MMMMSRVERCTMFRQIGANQPDTQQTNFLAGERRFYWYQKTFPYKPTILGTPNPFGGFHKWEYPKMDGLFQNQKTMDDWGVPPLSHSWKPPFGAQNSWLAGDCCVPSAPTSRPAWPLRLRHLGRPLSVAWVEKPPRKGFTDVKKWLVSWDFNGILWVINGISCVFTGISLI